MNIRCEGKHALIGGSTSGIGKACAVILADLGASVTLIARNEQKLSETVEHLKTKNQKNHGYIVADFSDPNTLKEKVEAYLSQHKNVDILINNTGGPPLKPALEVTADDLIAAFNQHLICFHLLSQRVIPQMQENGYGRIINITSYTAKQPLDNMIISNTIRGAISNWAKTMANELGSYGITVNNVLPGSTATERLTSLIKDRSVRSDRPEAEIMESITQAIPLDRLGKPEEIAAAVAFLASPAAAYINGVNLPVDGGAIKSI